MDLEQDQRGLIQTPNKHKSRRRSRDSLTALSAIRLFCYFIVLTAIPYALQSASSIIALINCRNTLSQDCRSEILSITALGWIGLSTILILIVHNCLR